MKILYKSAEIIIDMAVVRHKENDMNKLLTNSILEHV